MCDRRVVAEQSPGGRGRTSDEHDGEEGMLVGVRSPPPPPPPMEFTSNFAELGGGVPREAVRGAAKTEKEELGEGGKLPSTVGGRYALGARGGAYLFFSRCFSFFFSSLFLFNWADAQGA